MLFERLQIPNLLLTTNSVDLVIFLFSEPIPSYNGSPPEGTRGAAALEARARKGFEPSTARNRSINLETSALPVELLAYLWSDGPILA